MDARIINKPMGIVASLVLCACLFATPQEAFASVAAPFHAPSGEASALAGEPDTLDAAVTDAPSVPQAQAPATATPLTTGSGEEPGVERPSYPTPLANGTYVVQSALAGSRVVEVLGGNRADGANVGLYTSNKTAAQQWVVQSDEQGYYTFRNAKTGRYLDAGSGAKGANVRACGQVGSAADASLARKWIVAIANGAYTISPAADEGNALDVANGLSANGANVRIWTSNNTVAQRFWFVCLSNAPASERTVENGVYTLSPTTFPKVCIDVAGAGYGNGTNAQVYTANNTIAQRFYVEWSAKFGYYTIRSVATGKALDAAGGNIAARTNVQFYDANGTAAQLWAIRKNANGGYSLVNAKSGLALDVAGGKGHAGDNLQLYLDRKGNKSQSFSLTAVDVVPQGVYTLYSRLAPTRFVLDVPGGSKKAGTQEQLYRSNATMAQKFMFRRVAEDTYMVQNVYSGLYLADASGKVVQQKRNASATAQQWKASFEGNGVVLTNVASGSRMAASAATAANGTKVAASASSKGNAQRWRLKEVPLLTGGIYTLVNGGGKALDIAGGKITNGTNAQVYKANGTAAQKFQIKAQSGGYVLVNDKSARALDVKNGSSAAGANVRQWNANGTAAQTWRAELAETGGIVFVNKKSGKVLTAASGGAKNGANVSQETRNGTAAQTWNLTATSHSGISGNAELDAYLRTVVDRNGGDLSRCYYWLLDSFGRVDAMDSVNDLWGIQSDATSIRYALMVKRRTNYDCYGGGAMFNWIARACGYSANFRAGGVPSASQGYVSHGWTEIYRNGTTYVCDPSFGRYYRNQINFYMVTYETAPNDYRL